ncbi:hypothetical protein IE81DRAFT_12780 [Ceraceosorus guamensis]|uniref:TFIIS N-terminal domain-containing protein n=1 Tax=Ceraceosorus guamensis TaxID=1522189 RepID=A0A316W3Y2_9BASI|nr:hypothetical protein IE81DRAFT_12780 [Ceraceosorus guamensis]PWN44627.1 hypothetical protein IE81DRAFT_12780 [Ceraceosorus guamensis]
MERAADDDFDANKERRLATAKLRMLPSVVEVMQKQSLQQSMMDNNFLSGVRRWLEPLGDRSLPSLTIQNALFPLLEKLEIDTMTLKQSGLGKIVLFYTKCGRVSLDIKRIANKLIESWTRPILKRDASERAQKAAMAERAKKMREAEKERRRELGEMVDDDEEVEELAAAAAAAGGGGEHGKDAAQIKLNRFKRRLREGKK